VIDIFNALRFWMEMSCIRS